MLNNAWLRLAVGSLAGILISFTLLWGIGQFGGNSVNYGYGYQGPNNQGYQQGGMGMSGKMQGGMGISGNMQGGMGMNGFQQGGMGMMNNMQWMPMN